MTVERCAEHPDRLAVGVVGDVPVCGDCAVTRAGVEVTYDKGQERA